MAAAHSHGASVGARHRAPLTIAFFLTAAYMVAEVIGGLLTNSLALLSDAAHMGTDVLGLGMALAAIILAQRTGPAYRTYGTYRLEVLAALANAVLLFGVAGYVLWEAVERWANPPEVLGWQMGLVAAGGLVVNLISFRLLSRGAKESINVKGAYLEVLGDVLGSIGVLLAAVVIAVTGWRYADPIVAAAVGLLILPRTFILAAQAVRILMEAAPRGVDIEQVRARLATLPGVVATHDLHVWTITSGLDAASGHLVVAEDAEHHQVLDATQRILHDEFGIGHTTIQIEPASHEDRAQPC